MADAPTHDAGPITDHERTVRDRQMAAALEQLAIDLHGLIFDVQEIRTADREARDTTEGQRIAAAIRTLFTT